MVNPSEAARLLASLRKPKKRVWPECGREFENRGRARYRSYVCMHRASCRARYQHNREKILARRKGKASGVGSEGRPSSG